jgi:hypothetical protein
MTTSSCLVRYCLYLPLLRNQFEQAAFWDMLDHNSPVIAATSYLHNEKQFPPCNNNWICHLGHPWANERIDTLKKMLYGRGLDEKSVTSEGLQMPAADVEAILHTIEQNLTSTSSVMDLAHIMFTGKNP